MTPFTPGTSPLSSLQFLNHSTNSPHYNHLSAHFHSPLSCKSKRAEALTCLRLSSKTYRAWCKTVTLCWKNKLLFYLFTCCLLVQTFLDSALLVSHLPKCLTQRRYLWRFLNEFKILLTSQTICFRRNREHPALMLDEPDCPKNKKWLTHKSC